MLRKSLVGIPLSSLLLGFFLFASSPRAASREFSPQTLRSQAVQALRYLEQAQVQGEDPYYLPGEWKTQVHSIGLPVVAGVGKFGQSFEEPSAFVTGSLINLVADAYLQAKARTDSQEDLGFVPPMIEKARASLAPYRDPPGFNFYRLVQTSSGAWARGPIHLFLRPYIRGFAYIPPDADTTSVTTLALDFAARVLGEPSPGVSPELREQFESHVDRHRRPHYFDRFAGFRNTGAYLTWFMDDQNPEMPGSFAPPEAGPRIPFGVNDVDCLVNANVLRLYSQTGQPRSEAYADSCTYLKRIARHELHGRCGLYYPSQYVLPYMLAQARAAGADCLEESRPDIIEYLLSTRELDGSWINHDAGRRDPVQSTLWAVGALVKLGSPTDPDVRAAVTEGLRFVLKRARHTEQGALYWNGEVFFSAVPQARNTVLWRSAAYTTAVAAKVLLDAEKFLALKTKPETEPNPLPIPIP